MELNAKSGFRLGIAIFVIVISGYSPGHAQTTPNASSNSNSNTIETIIESNGQVEIGVGAGQRAQLARASELIRDGQVQEAEELLDQVISFFRNLMTDPGLTYVSVASSSELDAFIKNNSSVGQVVWLDWSFQRALYLKAAMKTASKQFPEALQLLDEQARIAPYAAAGHIERGYILSRQKKPDLALRSYETGLKLSRQFKSSKQMEASALRGMGFTLIEKGDLDSLDRAEKLLKESLVIEPGNKVAENELEHIQQLRMFGQ